ncbi:PAS domain S-box protein [Candidatus Atribacteria bacterium 1244-E10-H5-B2]|nr:MAG: PAS domain S-box protein [Candidatus Atribacteria bacterium 1244-E10-H5-B2]
MKDTKKTKEQLTAELAESEEKYRIQVEMATDAVFLETVEGRILECNAAGAKMFGYTKEEIVSLTISDLVPKDFIKTLPKIITEKETTHGKFVSRISKKKDGAIFPTEIATKLINIGEKPRLIAYIRDITQRKSAEKKRKSLLKKEREQHLKAVTLAKVALILTSKLSLSDVLEEVLRQVKRLVPYSACNIVLIKKGRLFNAHSVGYDKYGSEKFVNSFTSPVAKLSLDKKVIKSTKPLLIPDTHQDPHWIIFKETGWIRSRLSMPVCLGNKVIGLLNLDSDTPGKFVKDDIKKLQPLANAAVMALENARLFEEVRKEITERKQAEQAIQERENRFRELFKHMSSGVTIYEAKDNGRDFMIKDFNRAAEKIEKVKKEDILGKSVLKVFPGVKDFGLFKAFQEVYKTGKPQHYPISFYQDQRITGWRENHVYKLSSGEIVAVYDDITERKQAEEDLKKNEQFLNSIFESVQDGVSVLNPDLTVSHVNGIMNKWYKENLPLEGKKCYEVYHNADKPCDPCPSLRCLESGKTEWNVVPGLPGSPVEWIELYSFPIKDSNSGKITGVVEFVRDITERRQAEERLKKTMDATIDTMSRIIEAKDPYTSGHQHRVCQLAIRIAQEMKLPKDKIEGIRIASLIHDIGKIALPAEILSKPTKLTDIEFSLIKGHSQIGHDILKSIDFSYPIAQIVLQHHERLNGSGYPNGLRADKILLEARIIGVTDVVEAMSSHRPYRPALGTDKALEEISQNKGTLYDPEVVDACLKLFKEKEFKFE